MKALTELEKRRKQAALVICKTLSEETSIIAKPLSKIDIKNIPNSVEPAVKNWIRKYRGRSEVYGSGAMATHSIHARQPQDLDMVIDNPSHAARSLSQLIRDKGVKTKIVTNPEWGSYVVQVYRKRGWVDAIDIHPIHEHYKKYEFYGSSKRPLNKKGISLQRASDQLLRKANAITERRKDGSMGAAPQRELKDTIDFITTANLLLASMEIKSKAQLAKAKKVREELKIWKAHLTKLKGDKRKKETVRKNPISDTRKKQFVRRAVEKPSSDVDGFIFENGKIVERKVSVSKAKRKAKAPYTKRPHAKSPYQRRRHKEPKIEGLAGVTQNLMKELRKYE